jgi:Ser-tRNA(Ala) deacylase AlaX
MESIDKTEEREEVRMRSGGHVLETRRRRKRAMKREALQRGEDDVRKDAKEEEVTPERGDEKVKESHPEEEGEEDIKRFEAILKDSKLFLFLNFSDSLIF